MCRTFSRSQITQVLIRKLEPLTKVLCSKMSIWVVTHLHEYIPEDQPTVNAWYHNAEEIRKSTASLYGRVWWGVNDQFSWLAGDVMAGDMHHNWDQEGQFFYMSFNESNQYIG